MSYVSDHSGALATLTADGVAVTFSERAVTNDPTAGTTVVDATGTVAGYAIQTKGSANQYEQLTLIDQNPLTLLFSASTYGEEPSVGSTCSWDSVTYTVRAVQSVAPDSNPIVSRVVVSQ